MRLTVASWLGLQDIKHDDEDNGDSHDEDGRHGNDESGGQVTLSSRI